LKNTGLSCGRMVSNRAGLLDITGLNRETSCKVAKARVKADSSLCRKRRVHVQLSEPTKGRQTIALKSTMESVSEVESIAEKIAEEAGLDEDTRFHVTMAVREATVNAVLHGNEYDPAKQITATFENTGKELVFIITDQGKGLDPETLPDPLAPENLLRGTGRGIFIIRSFMDEVHFRQLHPGTELTLVKHLPAADDSRDKDRSPGTPGDTTQAQ